MALNLAELIVVCLLVDWVFRRWRIPGLAGMLLVGVAAGPDALGLIRPELRSVSADLRMMALIVILLRAGFELSKDTLRRVGGRALLFSFVPAVFEGVAVTFLGHWLLRLTYLESAILGSVLSAVSPAVVVPLMIQFIEERRGTAKGIPTLVLAASSIDDVFVIVVYSSLIGFYTGAKVNIAWKVAGIPLAILLGTGVGLVVGLALHRLFLRFNPRATKRLLVVLGISVFMVAAEHHLEGIVPFAALLGVMAVGFIILEKDEYMAHEISQKLGKLWVFAEIILFTLVGAKVDLHVALQAGGAATLLIALGLVARSVGSSLCLLRSNLTAGERLFVVVSYLPKATVQAAIGGAPLLAMKAAGMDPHPGEVILAAAALSILLTAPVGAWAIRLVGNRVLERETVGDHATPERAKQAIMKRLTVADVMDPDAISVREQETLQRVLRAFAESRGTVLPVVDRHSSLRGVIRLADLRPLLAERDAWRWLLASDVMRHDPPCLPPHGSLGEAMSLFETADLDALPVTEEDTGRLIGVLERAAAMQNVEERTTEWLAEVSAAGPSARVESRFPPPHGHAPLREPDA